MDLKNNVALVTGGASGLGRATVEHFVSKGAKAAIIDINDDKANEVISVLGSENVAYFKRYGFQHFSGTLIVMEVNDEKVVCLKMPWP